MLDLNLIRSIPVFDAQAKVPKLEQKIEHLERENRFLRVRVNDLKEENQDLKRNGSRERTAS